MWHIAGVLLKMILMCKWIIYHSILQPPDSTVFLNECLTFVVIPLCVHPVKTVKQPIDLCLYQSQLLFNHLQLLHPHCKDSESEKM